MIRTVRSLVSTVIVLLCLVWLFYVGLWGFDIRTHRPWKAEGSRWAGAYGEAVRFYPMAATALVSGFRGLAADLLWLKADSYWHHGQWHRLLPLYQLIVTIQPRFTLVWSMGGWHMAYNLSEMARRNPNCSPAQRIQEARSWMDKGILFLQEGLKYNKDKPDLYFDLGWTYFDKVRDYVTAIPYLEEAARKHDSMQSNKTLAHAYEKVGRYADALRMWESLDTRGDRVAKKFISALKQEMANEVRR